MTSTAWTLSRFRPTSPVIRMDREDAVYKTRQEKFDAVVQEVEKAHETGQPVLVGTITIETSELLSRMLKKRRYSAQRIKCEIP